MGENLDAFLARGIREKRHLRGDEDAQVLDPNDVNAVDDADFFHACLRRVCNQRQNSRCQ